MKITYLIYFVTFVFNLFHFGYAENLVFKAGDKASYTIQQTFKSKMDMLGQKSFTNTESSIEFDIEILDSNSETLSYPFSVAITPKKIYVTDIIRTCDDVVHNLSNQTSIDQPLLFTVDQNLKVEETTGFFKSDDKLNNQSSSHLWRAINATFEVFLMQVFHLANEDLSIEQTYPITCYQLLNIDDECLDEQQCEINETSAYVINKMDAEEIQGIWKGKAKVMDHETDMNSHVFTKAVVAWNPCSPLMQKREFKTKLRHSGNLMGLPLNGNFLIKQTWECTSWQ